MTRQLVPLGRAHLLAGVSRATVYRWVDRGELETYEVQKTPHHAMKPYVWSDDLLRCEARMRQARHAPKRVREQ